MSDGVAVQEAVGKASFAYGKGGLTVAYAAIEVGKPADEPRAEHLTTEGFLLSHLAIHFDTIAGGAATATVTLTWDAARDLGFSREQTETILLGTVALLCPGKDLAWDAAKLKVTNLPEANQHLRRTYRDGWAVKGL